MSERPKRRLPSKLAVALHWHEWQERTNTIAPWGFVDWGEPSCWACGWFQPTWKDWQDAELERCHIVPRGAPFDGLDGAQNLVLMCHSCHADHPDFENPEDTYEWMRNRSSVISALEFGLLTICDGHLVPTPQGIRYLHDLFVANDRPCPCQECSPERWSGAA